MRRFNVEIKWGIILACALFVFDLILKALGYHDEKVGSYMGMTMIGFLIMLVCIYLGISEKRRKYFESLSYTQGLVVGFVIGAMSLPLSLILNFLLVRFVSPDLLNNLVEVAMERGMNQDMASNNYNVRMHLVQTVLSVMGLSVVASMIVAVFTKKS